MFGLIIIKVVLISFVDGSELKSLQTNHGLKLLSNAEIGYVVGLSDIKYVEHILDKILIPRVVGTSNHSKVFEYIKSELGNLKWHIHIDEFEEETPVFGTLNFKNIIATINPKADRYLVLACHYDSKYFKNEVFVGATDSAVPCAMLLNLAKVLKNELNRLKNNTKLNIKLIFFDGEEAFLQWGPKDSIYGARHLADIYDKSLHSISTGETVSDLKKIDVFILLDLIGHKGTQFYRIFDNTNKWYKRFVEVEDKLISLGLIKKSKHKTIFHNRPFYGSIEDDHIPFLHKKVPILHLIGYPFPKEWHTPGDNRDIINMKRVEKVNKIIRVFVIEYLHLSVNCVCKITDIFFLKP